MKVPSGSRFLIIQQLKKVLRDAIPRLQSLEEANALEVEIYRARSNKILNDKEYLEFHNGIQQVVRLNGWLSEDLSAAISM